MTMEPTPVEDGAVAAQLAETIAHFEIGKVVARYCRGIDRLDAELINSVYWEDSTDNHGIFVGPGQDFAAYIIPFMRKHYDATTHVVGQSCIEVKGIRAAAETYFVGYHRKDIKEHHVVSVGGGRYVDTFERRHGEWRILARIVIMEWFQTPPPSDLPTLRRPSLEQFTTGRRNSNDPSYPVFANMRKDS